MRYKRIRALVFAGLLVSVFPAIAAGQGFKVVVNEANPADSISKGELSRVFMKQSDTWTGGQPVMPVDQTATSSTRNGFSKVVFARNASAIKSHWQRQIFSGRGVPPPEKASDDEVLAFVRANPGAIGYVSSDIDIGPGVKVLDISKKGNQSVS
jgi:ABC-type phosphate transport system substrate-binding protein